MKNKNLLIIVTGSIAAYKACEVVRLLRREGAEVQIMMTKSAQKFVGKTTFAALTNHEVITEMWLFPQQRTLSAKWPAVLQMRWFQPPYLFVNSPRSLLRL